MWISSSGSVVGVGLALGPGDPYSALYDARLLEEGGVPAEVVRS